MANWTTSDIPDQRGNGGRERKVVVVTGANSGIGLVTARELARAGATTVLACRDLGKGEDALAKLVADVPDADAALLPLDLADLSSVRGFATALADRHERLDLLVNNAGVMAIPYRRTADGLETQFGTNHLGHFALTGLLLDQLRAAAAPRVVTVSSIAHHRGWIDFDNLQGERSYNRWIAYAQSKLANLLFALELHRRTEAARLPLRSVAAHPGWTATNLQHVGPRMAGNAVVGAVSGGLMTLGNALFSQPDDQGALPSLYAATVPDLGGGSFVGPGGWFELRGSPTLVKPSRAARDPDTARRLWEASEHLTGIHYDL